MQLFVEIDNFCTIIYVMVHFLSNWLLTQVPVKLSALFHAIDLCLILKKIRH